MDSATQRDENQSLREWLPEFFRQEFALYPGRWSLVARMVIAATLSMIVIVTFRIPYGAVGVNCAFILSRENLLATAKSGFYFMLAFAAWVVLMPVGARMFASVPLTHFLWEGVTIFLCFFFLKAIAYFPLATGIVIVATSTMTIWYLPGPAELNVELTLWQILATTIGALITFLVEVVFRYFSTADPIVDGLDDRLRNIEEMLRDCSGTFPAPTSVVRSITQYAMTGTSLLRQQVMRSYFSEFEKAKASALISLVGRAIDLSAAIASGYRELAPTSQASIEKLRMRIALIRHSMRHVDLPITRKPQAPPSDDISSAFSELEVVTSLMESVLETNAAAHAGPENAEKSSLVSRVFVRDAFSNLEYLRFALAGTAASMLCYVVYVGLNWPGISTAVTTCVLTALSNVGSSRQKQLLRIGGAAIGGFVFGLGSQILVLPYIDSIVGLAILFACVTGISAYVATSSPRLSYAGLQMAFAFYLINVTDFSISLDLTIGRDRAVGVLLGIAAMWIVFERLYQRSAALEMVRMFVRSVRLVASLVPLSASKPAVNHVLTVRDEINNLFTNVNAEADAVLFESGEQRASHLAARERVRRWLATLRTLYLLELPLIPAEKYTRTSPLFQKAEAGSLKGLTESLNHIADCLEDQLAVNSDAHVNKRGTCCQETQAHNSNSTQQDGSPKRHELLAELLHELENDVLREPVFAP